MAIREPQPQVVAQRRARGHGPDEPARSVPVRRQGVEDSDGRVRGMRRVAKQVADELGIEDAVAIEDEEVLVLRAERVKPVIDVTGFVAAAIAAADDPERRGVETLSRLRIAGIVKDEHRRVRVALVSERGESARDEIVANEEEDRDAGGR